MAANALRLRRSLALTSSILNHTRHFSSVASSVAAPPSPSTEQNPSRFDVTRSIPKSVSFQFRSSRTFSSRARYNNDDTDGGQISPDAILFEGCDYNHWLITMDFPKDPKPTPEEMVETYVQTAAKVLGSVEEAKKKIYACSTTTYNGFQVEVSEEVSEQFKGLPGVVFVLPDSYIDPVNKEYGGDKYINGTIIPRPPPVQYGRQSGRFNDRNRDYNRPPRGDQSPMNNAPGGQGNYQGDRRGPMPSHGRDFSPPPSGGRDFTPPPSGNFNQGGGVGYRQGTGGQYGEGRGGQYGQRGGGSYGPGTGGQYGQGGGGSYGQGAGGQYGQGGGGSYGQGTGGQYGLGGGGSYGQGIGGSYGQGSPGNSGQGVGGPYVQGSTGNFRQGADGPYRQGSTGNFGQGAGGPYGQGSAGNFGQGTGGPYEQGGARNFGQGMGGPYRQGGARNVGQGTGGPYGQGTAGNVGQDTGGQYGQGIVGSFGGGSYRQGTGGQNSPGMDGGFGQETGVGSKQTSSQYGENPTFSQMEQRSNIPREQGTPEVFEESDFFKELHGKGM